MGLLVQEIDRDMELSDLNSIFEIDVFPAPEGEDKTMLKLLLLMPKNQTCICSPETKRVRNNITNTFRY